MCGRYTQTQPAAVLQERFGLRDPVPEVAARYNLAPSQMAPVVVQDGPASRLRFMRWGLVPFWAKSPAIGHRMINARAETAARKPAFRRALARRRCLVPADGFYEWRPTPGQRRKTPMRIVRRDRAVFAFAGLWEVWEPPEGDPLESFTILTTPANRLLAPIHDRMPVILPAPGEAPWLHPGTGRPDLEALCTPYPDDLLEAYEVSTLVNAPRHDTPECLTPVPGLFAEGAARNRE